MDFFDVLTLLGGLSLFLFGMNLMGNSLEKCAGSSLKVLLSKLTSRKILGFLTGLGVTAVIQSSSATTVMVVGFVNSGLLSLRQAIGVIMGANVGTTVTAWILSLTGLDGESFFIRLLEPTSFSPVLALIGVGLTMMAKSELQEGCGHDPPGICGAHVRHGHHERLQWLGCRTCRSSRASSSCLPTLCLGFWLEPF